VVDWWQRLSQHLHDRTDHRLRQLEIRNSANRVTIQATAPSHGVRQLAEQAAREIVPEKYLSVYIRVANASEAGDAANAGKPSADRPDSPQSAPTLPTSPTSRISYIDGPTRLTALIYQRLQQTATDN
jgi:hypothetical protein